MTLFQTLYQNFLELNKTAPFVAGFLTVWVTGVASFALKNVPGSLWRFISGRFLYELRFDNSGHNYANEQNYLAFLQWYLNQGFSKYSRSLALSYGWLRGSHKESITAGAGIHFFIFKWRLFWFKRNRLESSGVEKIKEEVVLTGLTRSRKLIEELINEFKYKESDEGIQCYRWTGRSYADPVDVIERPMSSVILANGAKGKIVHEIKEFDDHRDWYVKRGIAHKLVLVLWGPPGTGKTSIVRALATEYRRNIYQLSLTSLTNDTVFRAFSEVPKDSIILVEDFDSSITKTRFKKKLKKKPILLSDLEDIGIYEHEDYDDDDEEENPVEEQRLSLSGLLNAMDGIVALNGVTVFMTTNKLSNIDPAILRKGRVDVCIEIGEMQDADIKEYIRIMCDYPNHIDNIYAPILGCDLYDLFRLNKYDTQKFMDSIPKSSIITLTTTSE